MSLRSLRAAVETWSPGRGIAADPLHRIASAWSDIVGRNVAANSEPVELNGTTLLVATRSSAWSQQLQLLSLTILTGIRALPGVAEVTRLAFRTGGLRRAGKRRGAQSRAPRSVPQPGGPLPEPAADADEALARLRRRIEAVRRTRTAACEVCGAPQDGPGNGRCAPCAGEAEHERELALARIIYVTPWLGLAELRAEIPDLSGAEFERTRRRLLQRWWSILDRAKRRGEVSRSGLERHVASSYVLLQSRLPPDRITPAVVANLLGEDVVRLLWPA